MRLSIDDDDFPSLKHQNAKVYLNGRKQDCVTVADEENGYIIKYKVDNKGSFSVVGDLIETEKICGRVEIRNV